MAEIYTYEQHCFYLYENTAFTGKSTKRRELTSGSFHPWPQANSEADILIILNFAPVTLNTVLVLCFKIFCSKSYQLIHLWKNGYYFIFHFCIYNTHLTLCFSPCWIEWGIFTFHFVNWGWWCQPCLPLVMSLHVDGFLCHHRRHSYSLLCSVRRLSPLSCLCGEFKTETAKQHLHSGCCKSRGKVRWLAGISRFSVRGVHLWGKSLFPYWVTSILKPPYLSDHVTLKVGLSS